MSKETYMIESLTREVIVRLMEDDGLPMREAMDKLYSSKTYNSLTQIETGLYFQSASYIYDELSQENP